MFAPHTAPRWHSSSSGQKALVKRCKLFPWQWVGQLIPKLWAPLSLLNTVFPSTPAEDHLHALWGHPGPAQLCWAADSLSEGQGLLPLVADLRDAPRGLVFRDRVRRPWLQNGWRREEVWGTWLRGPGHGGTRSLAESHGLRPRHPERAGRGGAAFQDGNSVHSLTLWCWLSLIGWRIWKGEIGSPGWNERGRARTCQVWKFRLLWGQGKKVHGEVFFIEHSRICSLLMTMIWDHYVTYASRVMDNRLSCTIKKIHVEQLSLLLKQPC